MKTICFFLLVWCPALFGDLVCGTWNLRWFPSGRAEHRASARVEGANIADAAEVLRGSITAAKDAGVVIFLQELRDYNACSNLVSAIGNPKLAVASVSGFRDWDRRLSWQQCGIITTLPVVETSWSYWKRANKITAPRGYAFAVVDAGEQGLVACFCVHLKSNYGATKPEIRRQNALKREIATTQLVDIAKKIKTRDGRTVTHIVVAGDFNMDPFSKQFADEKTCATLVDAGFVNCFEGVPLSQRGTHPGTGRFPASTLDFVFHRGFAGSEPPTLGPEIALSDHRMVYLRLH